MTACSLRLADAKFLDSFLTSGPVPRGAVCLGATCPCEAPGNAGRGRQVCSVARAVLLQGHRALSSRSPMISRHGFALVGHVWFILQNDIPSASRLSLAQAPGRRCRRTAVLEARVPTGGTCSATLVVRAGLPELSVRLDPTQLISSRARADSGLHVPHTFPAAECGDSLKNVREPSGEESSTAGSQLASSPGRPVCQVFSSGSPRLVYLCLLVFL